MCNYMFTDLVELSVVEFDSIHKRALFVHEQKLQSVILKAFQIMTSIILGSIQSLFPQELKKIKYPKQSYAI